MMQLTLLDISGKETKQSLDIQWLPIEKLYPHPDNPRLIYKEEIIESIASSIEKDGFQPCYALLVRPFEDGYQILSGHTRLKASQKVGCKSLPCWVKDMSDEDVFCPFTEIANSLIFAYLTTNISTFEMYSYISLKSIKIGFKDNSFIGECSSLRENKANWLEKYFPLDKLKTILSVWNMGTCPDVFEWDISPYAIFFRVPFNAKITNKPILLSKNRDFDKEIEAICKEFDKTHTECVYFVQAKQLKLIKIGVTKNLKSRLSALNTGCPDDLKVLKIIQGDVSLEKLLHEKFAHLRVKGEWFTPSAELLKYIDEV